MKRKLTATQIFNGSQYLNPGAVLVFDHDRLIDIISIDDAGDDIEHFDGTLLPGMVNTHCHLELSHLKYAIPRKTGLVDFVKQVVVKRNADEEEIQHSIIQMDEKMWNGGVQAVGDICNTTDTINCKMKSKISYHSFIEAIGFPPHIAASRFRNATEIRDQFQHMGLGASITPHAPYSVSPKLFGMINGDVGDGILSIHNQEIPDENMLFQNRSGDFLRLYQELNMDAGNFIASGTSALQSWLAGITKKRSLLLVHNVAISEADVDFAIRWAQQTDSRIFFTVCIRANEYISGLRPPVEMMLTKGVSITLGTDSLASNNALDMAHELNALENQFQHIPVDVWLKALTSNGAAALLKENRYGHLGIGTAPGLVLMKGQKGRRSFSRVL